MQCKQCRANLPNDARYCLQCGTPAEPGRDSDSRTAPEFLQPALAGGLVLGLLSSIPLISIGNLLCCMWVIAGGGLASYMLMRQSSSGVTYGDGAFVGVLSGVVGAAVATIMSIPIKLIAARTFESQQETIEAWMQEYAVEGPMRELLLGLASPELSGMVLLFMFIINALVFSLFAMIGGILTVALVQGGANEKKGTAG